jgi:hypothetical protein
MFHLRSAVTQPLTRELVETFATMTPSPTERPFSEKRLRYLQDAYTEQRFVSCQWSSVWLGGSQLRMNGQHSSTMLMKLPEPFPVGLYAHIDEYEADTPEDIARLFRQFDARDSARSPADVSGAYQHTYPELLDVTPQVAKIGIEGIAWYLRVVEGVPTGKGDDRYQLFRQPVHYDFLHWIDTLLSMKTPEMKRIEVIAALYATDLVSPEAAHTFWEDVARGGIPYEEQHPATVLDKWLKSCRDGTCEDKMKQAYHYQGCLYAWNAYRDEKPIKDIRFNTSKGLYVPHV